MSNRNPCPELCRSPLSPCWKVACVGLAVLCGTVVAAEPTATEDHWAFRPVLRPPVPETRDRTWPRTPVDRFLLSRLENRRGQVAPAADRRSFLRRLTYNLTGLPPTPAELRDFEADRSPVAFDRVVDRLLSSARYGERWGRHWLDISRYADSNGLDENRAYVNAFHFRDYVIDAFNRDIPFDEFIRSLIAGDLLPEPERPRGISDGDWQGHLASLTADRILSLIHI